MHLTSPQRRILTEASFGGTLYGHQVRHGSKPIDDFIYKIAAGMRDWDINDDKFTKLFYGTFGSKIPARLNQKDMVDALKQMLKMSSQSPKLIETLINELDLQLLGVDDPDATGTFTSPQRFLSQPAKNPAKHANTPKYNIAQQTKQKQAQSINNAPGQITIPDYSYFLGLGLSQGTINRASSQPQYPLSPFDAQQIRNMSGAKRINKRNPVLVTVRDSNQNEYEIVMGDHMAFWVPHQKSAPDPQKSENFLNSLPKKNRSTTLELVDAKPYKPAGTKP